MASVALGQNNPLIRRLRSHANPSVIYRSVDGLSQPAASLAPSGRGLTKPVQVSQAVVQPRDPRLPLGMVLDYDPGIALPSPPAADLQRSRAEQAIAAVESSSVPTQRRPARQPEIPAFPQPPSSPELPTAPLPARPISGQTVQESTPPAPKPATTPSAPIQRAPDAGTPAQPVSQRGVVPPGVDPNAPIASHSTITEGEYARLKAFMEGHQAKLAQEKAEQEALQRTPEWQAQEAERQKEEAERQRHMEEIARRQELAKAGRLPRAKVSYVSDPSAPVTLPAAPQPAPVQTKTDDVSKVEERAEAPSYESPRPEPTPGPSSEAPPVQRKAVTSDEPARPSSPPPAGRRDEPASQPPPAPSAPEEKMIEPAESVSPPMPEPGETLAGPTIPATVEPAPIQRAEERPQPSSEPEQPNLGRRLLKAARSILRIEDDEAGDDSAPGVQDDGPSLVGDEIVPDIAPWQEQALETGSEKPSGDTPAAPVQRSPEPGPIPESRVSDREAAVRQADEPSAESRSLIRPPSEPPQPRADRGTQPPAVQRARPTAEVPQTQTTPPAAAEPPPVSSEEVAEEATLILSPPEPGPPAPETRLTPALQREMDITPAEAEPAHPQPEGPEGEGKSRPLDLTGQQAPAPEKATLRRQVEAPPAPSSTEDAGPGERALDAGPGERALDAGPGERALEAGPETLEEPQQKVPLEEAWPVQRLPEIRPAIPVAKPPAKPGKVAQRKPVARDEYSDDIHEALEDVFPGRATDSSIELVTPRRPRPSLQRQPTVEEPAERSEEVSTEQPPVEHPPVERPSAEQPPAEVRPVERPATEPLVDDLRPVQPPAATQPPARPSPPLQRIMEQPQAEAEPRMTPELQKAPDKAPERVEEPPSPDRRLPEIDAPSQSETSAVKPDSLLPAEKQPATKPPSGKPEIISRSEEPVTTEPARPSEPRARVTRPEPYLVPTDVGPLPSDMWEALGETPPPPRPEPRMTPPGARPVTQIAAAPPAPTLQRVALDAVSPDLFRQETAPETGRQPETLASPARMLTLERPAPVIQRVESAEPGSNGTQTAAAEAGGAEEAEAGGDEAAIIRKLAQLIMPEIRRRLQVEWERGRGRL